MAKLLKVLDDGGLYWSDDASKVRVGHLRIKQEGGSTQLWIGANGDSCVVDELLVYLSPQEAMSFAKAFERCAIAALKESS